MQINGFRLQQDIREAQEERNLLQARFTPALQAFPGEAHDDPEQLAQEIARQELRIAALQVAQMRFNLQIEVSVATSPSTTVKIPLGAAVKRLGGLERVTTLWRGASSTEDNALARRYGRRNLTRDADAVVSQRTVSFEKANELRRVSRKEAATLRAAIQSGNSQSVEASTIGYPL
jgi:hypothetical protein